MTGSHCTWLCWPSLFILPLNSFLECFQLCVASFLPFLYLSFASRKLIPLRVHNYLFVENKAYVSPERYIGYNYVNIIGIWNASQHFFSFLSIPFLQNAASLIAICVPPDLLVNDYSLVREKENPIKKINSQMEAGKEVIIIMAHSFIAFTRCLALYNCLTCINSLCLLNKSWRLLILVSFYIWGK